MKRYIRYLVSTLIFCIIVLLIKNEFSSVLLKDANYGMPALIESGEVDNLYMGSSMFRQGIDIVTLDENNERNYILTYNGNQPALEYYQLKKLLTEGLKIKNLYIDMYVYSAWAEPKISDEKMLMEFGLKDKMALYNLIAGETISENAKIFWQMFVSGNNELLSTWVFSNGVVNGIFYKGGSTNKPIASDKNQLEALSVPEIDNEMNLIQRAYSLKIIELAKNNGINLTYIESPKYNKMAQNDSYISAMRQYMDFLDEESVDYIICESTWNLTGQNRDVRKYLYDNENSGYYVDNGHLSYNGRVEFTKRIAELCID